MKVQRELVKTSMLFAFLIFLAVVDCGTPKKVNCRIHVYAPICRGAGAKRDVNDAHRSIDAIRYDFERTFGDDGEFYTPEVSRDPRKTYNLNDLVLWKAILRRAKELEDDPRTVDLFY